jgi:hypothetical protein
LSGLVAGNIFNRRQPVVNGCIGVITEIVSELAATIVVHVVMDGHDRFTTTTTPVVTSQGGEPHQGILVIFG